MRSRSMTSQAWVLCALVAGLLLVGCDGNDGLPGQDGVPGTSTATLSGVVTNGLSGAPVPGAVVTTDPVIPGVNIVASGTGAYSVDLPIGQYDLVCTDANFQPGTAEVSLVAGVASTANFALMPESPVMLNVTGLPAAVNPGDAFGLTVSVTPMDGSTVTGYAWSQTNSVTVGLGNTDQATCNVTLPGEQAFRDELFHQFLEVERWVPQGISHFALEERLELPDLVPGHPFAQVHHAVRGCSLHLTPVVFMPVQLRLDGQLQRF